MRIRTSKDPVGDSLFYREVPLPFLTAVQDPSRIRWRFGTIDIRDRAADRAARTCRCAATATRSRDNGSVLGLDVDYGNDKGGYGILPVSRAHGDGRREDHHLERLQAGDGELTFGLLSRVSPTGAT